ncbi:MAG: sulfite exporter TauE/SafE family protein [Acidobacteriota bacterium]
MTDPIFAPGVGLLVGILVGMTGVGGGVVLLPLLIFGLGVAPLEAVGTGAAFSALSKVVVTGFNLKHKTVDWRLVGALSLGSIPASFGGVAMLAHLKTAYGSGLNSLLEHFIGWLLVLVPLLLIAQVILEKRTGAPLKTCVEHLPGVNRYTGAVVSGLIAGFLVGITSIGSGIVVIILLLLFYTRPTPVLVATDVAHAVILMGATALMHFELGTVDLSLVFWLLLGAVPGAWIGTHFGARIPGAWLRTALILLLVLTGIRMI